MSSKHLKTLLFLVSLFLLSTTIGGVMVNLLTLSVLGHRLESDQLNLLLGRRLESDQPNLLLGHRLQSGWINPTTYKIGICCFTAKHAAFKE